MSLIALGKVTVASAGTIVQATVNQSTPSARIGVQSIMVQVLSGNAGRIYVGTAAMVVSTGVGVLAVLPAPSSATTGPFASVTFTEALAPAGLNLADIYLDCSANGDGAYVSATVQ